MFTLSTGGKGARFRILTEKLSARYVPLRRSYRSGCNM